MSVRANPALFSLFLCFGLSGLLLAWRVGIERRTTPASGPLIVLLLATSQILVAYAMSFAMGPPSRVIWWIDITYIGWLVAPPALMCFVASLTGHPRWVSPKAVALLAIEPVVMALVIFSPNGVDWFFNGGRDPVTFDFIASSWAYWVFIAYANIMLLLATVLVIASVRAGGTLPRRQMAIVIASLIFPWIVSYFSIPNVRVFGADPSVLSLIVSVTLIYLLARYRVLGVQPMAERGRPGASGVVVLDDGGRIVEMSATAAGLLGGQATGRMGRRAEDAWEGQPQVLEALRNPGISRLDVDGAAGAWTAVRLDRTPIADTGDAVIGTLVVVRRENARVAR